MVSEGSGQSLASTAPGALSYSDAGSGRPLAFLDPAGSLGSTGPEACADDRVRGWPEGAERASDVCV